MRRLGVLAILAAAGCSRERETPIARIDGPIAAELIRIDKRTIDLQCAGGHGIGICLPERRSGVRVALRMLREPRVVVPLGGCADKPTRGELVADPAGTRLAYRCDGGPWSAVLIGKTGHAFEAPQTFAALDWPKAPSLPGVLGSLWKWSYYDAELEVLVAEAKAWGSDAVVDLLVEATESIPASDTHDFWEEQRRKLSPAQQAAIGTELTKRTLAAGARVTDPLLLRTLVLGSLDSQVVEARLDEVLARPKDDAPWLARALFLTLMKQAPDRAVARGCAVLGRPAPTDCAGHAWVVVEAAALAVAEARATCPELVRWESKVCSVGTCAPDAPCDPADIEARFAQISRTIDGSQWRGGSDDPHAAIIAAKLRASVKL